MRHLMIWAAFAAALAAYAAGLGPSFFGTPWLGAALLLAGLALELQAWRRALRRQPVPVRARRR